jgi:DnaK suppressor protein
MASVREMLLAERERARQRVAVLEAEFAGLAEAASAAGTDDEHDPEGATLAFERQHAAALLESARDRLDAIGAALRRLEAGRYGVCERCGQPIGAGRLAARPAASTCIRCAGPARLPLVRRAYQRSPPVSTYRNGTSGIRPNAPQTSFFRPLRSSRDRRSIHIRTTATG